MSERTALILATLSHQWAGPILVVVCLSGLIVYRAEKAHRRARQAANFAGARVAVITRTVSAAVFSPNLLLLIIAFLHIGCATLVKHEARCQSNVKQLSLALLIYSRISTSDFPRLRPGPRRFSHVFVKMLATIRTRTETGSNAPPPIPGSAMA